MLLFGQNGITFKSCLIPEIFIESIKLLGSEQTRVFVSKILFKYFWSWVFESEHGCQPKSKRGKCSVYNCSWGIKPKEEPGFKCSRFFPWHPLGFPIMRHKEAVCLRSLKQIHRCASNELKHQQIKVLQRHDIIIWAFPNCLDILEHVSFWLWRKFKKPTQNLFFLAFKY